MGDGVDDDAGGTSTRRCSSYFSANYELLVLYNQIKLRLENFTKYFIFLSTYRFLNPLNIVPSFCLFCIFFSSLFFSFKRSTYSFNSLARNDQKLFVTIGLIRENWKKQGKQQTTNQNVRSDFCNGERNEMRDTLHFWPAMKAENLCTNRTYRFNMNFLKTLPVNSLCN